MTATSRPQMPKGFTDNMKWREVLDPLLPLAGLLGELLKLSEQDWALRRASRDKRQREMDVAATTAEMFFLLAV